MPTPTSIPAATSFSIARSRCVGGPVRSALEGSDEAERAAVLEARVRVEGRAEAHPLDRIERRLALDLEVFDVGQPGLRSVHSDMLEQMFALNKLGCDARFEVLCLPKVCVGVGLAGRRAISRSRPYRRLRAGPSAQTVFWRSRR